MKRSYINIQQRRVCSFLRVVSNALLVCSFITTYHPPFQAAVWPSPQPLHETYSFEGLASGADAPVLVFIEDLAGTPVYKLVCHSGNFDDSSEYDFSGTFQCALFAVAGTRLTSGNLLAADTKDERSTDWWNRGRMRAAQLRGECLAYPEYSILRHFKLRGMLITFRFTAVEWANNSMAKANPVINKFKLTLDVAPDRSAYTPFAAALAGPKPPNACYP